MALRKKQAPVHSPCILSALVSQHVCERLFVFTAEASGAARRVLKAKALVETGVVLGKKGGFADACDWQRFHAAAAAAALDPIFKKALLC